MIIQCNSCQKSFTVADDAISKSGRLVQCGSCGSKWTQFPLKEMTTEEYRRPQTALKTESTKTSVKSKKVKSKKKINPYSEEYLRKKHGIKIINPSSLSVKVHKIKKNSSFGFYSYITILLVLTITAFGILNLTKEIIIFNFPKNEKYIVYLYETLNNIKTIFYNIVFNF